MSATKELPAVAGRIMDRSIGMFEQACLVQLEGEQAKIRPDNHLIAILCDAVRLGREYSDRHNAHHEVLLAATKIGTGPCGHQNFTSGRCDDCGTNLKAIPLEK